MSAMTALLPLPSNLLPLDHFAINIKSSSSRYRRLSLTAVLVMAAPPDAGLVAPSGCAVEPLVHAPQAVQPARIGGIGVIDDAVLAHERTHARPLPRVCGL